MPETYTRQSSFANGDVIDAPLFNAEYDQLVLAFDEVLGHAHDGTVGGGAPTPLLKDPSLTHDFTLGLAGVTGSVVLDEDDMVSDSATMLVTQQSVKAYVDAGDLNLQGQIDTFATSNHAHSNQPLVDAVGTFELKTASFTAVYGYSYLALATTGAIDITLPTLVTGQVFVLCNSIDSTDVVQVLNPSNTIKGSIGTVPSGTDLILAPSETIVLVVTGALTLEIMR